MIGLSLGSGCGAMDLAMQSVGVTTVAYCEIDPYAQAVLHARMRDGWLDSAPLWPDARTVDGMAWRGRVDIVYSGIPCQPFSAAGKRQGAADDRNLWPFVYRQIAAIRPRLVFIENVPNAQRYFWSDVLPDLQGLGYEGPPPVKTSAAELGAGHIRERLFVLARDASATGLVRADAGDIEPRQEQWWREAGAHPVRDREAAEARADDLHADADECRGCKGGLWDPGENPEGRRRISPTESGWSAFADASGSRRDGWAQDEEREQEQRTTPQWSATGGPEWWATEPRLPRLVHGSPHRVDRVRLAGNIATPQQTVLAWRLLNEAMK